MNSYRNSQNVICGDYTLGPVAMVCGGRGVRLCHFTVFFFFFISRWPEPWFAKSITVNPCCQHEMAPWAGTYIVDGGFIGGLEFRQPLWILVQWLEPSLLSCFSENRKKILACLAVYNLKRPTSDFSHHHRIYNFKQFLKNPWVFQITHWMEIPLSTFLPVLPLNRP